MVRGSRERLLGGEGLANNIVAKNVPQRNRVRRGDNVIGGDFGDSFNRIDDGGELAS
jgi:hypothetical protein